MSMATCSVFSRAKINLMLAVLAREAGGFHQIETVFCALELADEIEVQDAGDDVTLRVLAPPEDAGDPPDLGPMEQNLAWRAAASFFDAAGLPPRARITLTKRIPAGAGLGGGSSNAAAVLGALNSLHGAPLSGRQLLEIGARLGSDVPFFQSGATLALAWGRGTRLAPLPRLPARPVLLAVPAERVATADAYAELAASRGADHVVPPVVRPAITDWGAAAAMAHNDFEAIILARLPRLAELRLALEEEGALIARMTGTGSVIFGLFEDPAAAQGARATLGTRFPDVHWLLTST
jgi:4-diphosphocytidyl-2-C-methyl-D-erythritol kinase